MPAVLILLATLFMATAFTAAQQEEPAGKPPKKGDRVVIRGCLSGPVLESNEMKVVDGTGTLTSALTFRLTGDKSLLRKMRKDEDGRIVEVTGVLKSDLPQDDRRLGKKIGKTRIVVGMGTQHPGQTQAPPPMPVLEVKSYEAHGAVCRR